ncbi:MAG: hypothetical protein J0I06_09750 [Planctomycetes bacterium]|nr:hypothetical protein [Planctomycetota bacterium]
MSAPTRAALAGLLALASAAGAPADDRKDAFGDPLPDGATARLGTVRGGPMGHYGTAVLPPKYDAFLFSDQNGLRLQDVATGRAIEIGTNGPARSVGPRAVLTVSADGRRAVIDRYGVYEVLEVATGKSVQTIKSSGYSGFRSAVSLSADGKLFAYDARTRGGKEAKQDVVVWDVDKNEQAARVAVLQNESASAVLSPDGKTLATYGQHFDRNPNPNAPADAVRPERTVQVWDVATGKQLAALSDPTGLYGGVLAAAFAPDGKTIATSSGGVISLWELPSGKHKETLLSRSTQGAKLAFAPDGKTLAAVDQYGAVERWALPEGKPLPLTEFPAAIFRSAPSRFGRTGVQPAGLGFADNDRVVVWGTLWGRAVAWEAPGGRMLTPVAGHLTDVTAVGFAANGRDVITVGLDRRVVRWDAATGKPALAHTFSDELGISDNRVLVGPGGGRVLYGPLVYDLETGAEQFRLPVALALPSDDFTRALGVVPVRTREEPTTCAVWNLDTRKKVATLELPGRIDGARAYGEIAAAFSPDNSRLVTAVTLRGPDGRETFVVTGWDLKTGKKLGEFGEPRSLQGTTIAAAKNNSGAVLASYDGKLWVADYETGTRADTIDEAPRGQLITRPTFSPDGKLLAAGVPAEKAGEYGVRVYDWPSGRVLHTFVGHRGQVTALAFSPDGKTLASGSGDTTVLLWDVSKVR